MYGRSAALARGDYGRAARMRGDPGIFSFLGKAVGTIAKVGSRILPGPAGAVLGTVGGFLGGRASVPSTPAPPSGSFLGVRAGGPRGLTVGVETYRGARAMAEPSGAAAVAAGADGCPKGFHRNKSGYYTSSGYVAPGAKCVRNRRMNPLNPRALRRGIRRGKGAIKLLRKTAGAMGHSVVSKRAPKLRKR